MFRSCVFECLIILAAWCCVTVEVDADFCAMHLNASNIKMIKIRLHLDYTLMPVVMRPSLEEMETRL